jgi:hypothetical protein
LKELWKDEQPMRSLGYALLPVVFLVSLAVCAVGDASAATSPGFTLTASNVSVSDTGSGSSSYTITSVGGFTGKVGASCFEPEIDGALVIPNCDVPEQFLTIPANGSVSGTMPFTPPSSVSAKNRAVDRRSPGGPLAAGAMLLAGLAAARRRLRWSRTLSTLLVCTGLLAGLTATGCGGHGGLAMAHGTYSYNLQAVDGIQVASIYIKVVVR